MEEQEGEKWWGMRNSPGFISIFSCCCRWTLQDHRDPFIYSFLQVISHPLSYCYLLTAFNRIHAPLLSLEITHKGFGLVEYYTRCCLWNKSKVHISICLANIPAESVCIWMAVTIIVVCGVFKSSKLTINIRTLKIMCSMKSGLTHTLCTLSQSCSKEKQATSNFPLNSKAKLFGFFECSCSSVTDCLFEAKLYTWNQLESAGMCCTDLELICKAGWPYWERQIGGRWGVWVSVVSQLVTVSGGLHHLAAELVPQHHLLTIPILFHPTEFHSAFWGCFVKFLDYVKTKQHLECPAANERMALKVLYSFY